MSVLRRRARFKKRNIKHTAHLSSDKNYIHTYGLRNKTELRRAEWLVSKYRQVCKNYVSNHPIYIASATRLVKKGIIENMGSNILDVTVTNILQRRLQTVLYKKFNLKPLQSRQLITAKKITVNGERVKRPSYLVDVDAQKQIKILGGR